jgi:hypothetical protein
MKKIFIPLLITVSVFNYAGVEAMEHPPGHGSKNRGGGVCTRPRMEKFTPANMATVAPGSEFSFVAFNIDNTDDLTVTAKKLPVEIRSEFKDPFFVVTGKLPDSLRNTVARINIKIDAKTANCEAEAGWLLKISE